MNGLTVDVRFQRGDFRLVADFTVAPGEVLAVLGPNGAGKTTLLRLLAGLLAVTEGTITVGGRVWDDHATGEFVPATDRLLGLVFQDYRLFPHLSVLDNVAFSARARGARRTAARRLATETVDRLGLTELSGRRPGELSGGQAQRVAVARALAAQPELLLLDEPLAALDARTRMELRTELRLQLTDFAGPSIVVTHDPLEALVLADRILVLESGRVVQVGRPAEVARKPATEYVARLMGLNLYAGVLTDPTSGRVELDSGGTLFTICPDGDRPHPAGTAMLVALPPAAIALHLAEPGASSPRNVWPAVVSGVELLTDRVRVAVTGPPDALVDVTPAALAELGLEPGRRIWLSAKATEATAYPAPRDAGLETGRETGHDAGPEVRRDQGIGE